MSHKAFQISTIDLSLYDWLVDSAAKLSTFNLLALTLLIQEFKNPNYWVTGPFTGKILLISVVSNQLRRFWLPPTKIQKKMVVCNRSTSEKVFVNVL